MEVRYFCQSNQGPSAARNFGIKYAHAPYIAFLDSDDEWLPGKLKAQLEFFDRNPDYLICQTDEIWVRRGRRVNPMKKHKKFGGFIFEKCLPLSIVSPSCVMVRREFFVPPPVCRPKGPISAFGGETGGGIDQVGLFDESLPACEDYDLWLRASARFPIGFIERPYVIKYGGHEDQRSRQFPVMDQFRIKALIKLLDSGKLTSDQKELVTQEIVKKAAIISRGALKRGKVKEARYYEDLIERVNSTVIARTQHFAKVLGTKQSTGCHPRESGDPDIGFPLKACGNDKRFGIASLCPP